VGAASQLLNLSKSGRLAPDNINTVLFSAVISVRIFGLANPCDYRARRGFAEPRIHWLPLISLEVMRRTGKAKSNAETRKKSKVKTKPTSQPLPTSLKGWQQIAGFLGQPISVAQRWAKTGMPVTREDRFVTASPNALNEWLGRESGGEPVHVVTPETDLSAELKRGLAYVRREHSTSRKSGAR
jgi:hypothetical protein